VRALLSDGSGLTARQVAGRLAEQGHHVEALSPDPLCLCRFTRHVRRVHRVPAYGTEPFAWLDAALDVYATGGFDVLFPTQEQVAILARAADRTAAAGVRTAVPAFAALSAVQDKLSARATLSRLGIPQPRSTVLASADELRAWQRLPVFVKTPIGTATVGVRRIDAPVDLHTLAGELDRTGVFDGEGVLAQDPVDGPLVMAQSVFAHGELVAAHANLRAREGAGGGASHKRSIDPGVIREHLEVLGRDLGWHGALSADVILSAAGPVVVDVNPRLVEPVNAWLSGVDLVGALLDIATGPRPEPQPAGRPGVATHQLLLAVLGAAQDGTGRRGIAAELCSALARTGSYRGSTEELTPWRGDLRALAPVAAAAAVSLARPAWSRWFTSGSVASYALTPTAYREIAASRADAGRQ
jgi:biotin carboxylase